MGHVAHRWPTKKATSGPSESHERLGKTVFSTQYRKNRPRNAKGHKGGRHARLRGRGRHSRQPWTLRPLTRPPGPPLPSVGAPYCADRGGVCCRIRPYPCPLALPPVGLPRERTPFGSPSTAAEPPPSPCPHRMKKRGPAAAGPPTCGHGKPARPSAWADAHATGAPIKYIGKKSGESIPTLRVARTPARAGARATGAPIWYARRKSSVDAAGWLPTAEGA